MRNRSGREQGKNAIAIVVLATPAETRRLARCARRLRVRVETCRHVAEAARVFAREPLALVVTRERDRAGTPVGPLLKRLRRNEPACGIVLLIDARCSSRAAVEALRFADEVLFERQLHRPSAAGVLRRALARHA